MVTVKDIFVVGIMGQSLCQSMLSNGHILYQHWVSSLYYYSIVPFILIYTRTYKDMIAIYLLRITCIMYNKEGYGGV